MFRFTQICALFGAVVGARKCRANSYAYSSYFEQMFWTYGSAYVLTCLVALPELHSSTDTLVSTIVITSGYFVTFTPDIILSIRYDMLNKTASKLAALNTWLYRNNLSSQDMLKLATIATLENIPSTSKASLVYTLEERLKKNITYNLGMDLVTDSPEHEDNELEEQVVELEERISPSHAGHMSYDHAPAAFSPSQERSTRPSNRKQGVEEIELTHMGTQKLIHRNNEPGTTEELEPLQVELPATTLAGLDPLRQGTTLGELKQPLGRQ